MDQEALAVAAAPARFKRHDLVWLSGAGRRACLANARPLLADATRDQIGALVLNPRIPAIVSRQEERAEENLLDAGFSSPEKYDGSRLRVAVVVAVPDIEKHRTPFDVADMPAWPPDFPPSARALAEELRSAAERNGFAAGFFGSLALGRVTNLLYFGDGSDIDLALRPARAEPDARALHSVLLALETKTGRRIDAEIEHGPALGLSLKELFSPGKTVLAKGRSSVELLPKSELGYLLRGKINIP